MNARRITKWSIAAVVLLTVCWILRTVTSYSAICTHCLQHFNGLQKQVLGITYYHSVRPNQRHRGLASPDALGHGIPSIDPALYNEIFGRKCSHSYQRLGMCKYSITGVGCYGGAGGFQPVWDAIEEVYRAYSRINDRALAQKSFAIIERRAPTIKDNEKWKEFEAFSHGLALVLSKEEWQRLIESEQAGGLLINDARKNLETLRTRLLHADVHVREHAMHRLADLNEAEAWIEVGNALSDPELAPKAATRILWALHPSLLGKALRHFGKGSSVKNVVWPFPHTLWPWHNRLSESQIRTLLDQNDPWVDAYCLPHIWFSNRLDMLESVMTALNKRPTAAAMFWSKQLIAGPWPFYALGAAEPVPFEQLGPQVTINDARWHSFAVLLTNSNFGPFDPKTRPYQIRRGIADFSHKPEQANWDELRLLSEQWIKETGDPVLMAAYAQVMYASDPVRTRDWIIKNLKPGQPKQGLECILAAAGSVADTTLLASLLELIPSFEGTPNLDSAQSGYLSYAVHRCRRIQDWKVVKSNDGTYSISKPR